MNNRNYENQWLIINNSASKRKDCQCSVGTVLNTSFFEGLKPKLYICVEKTFPNREQALAYQKKHQHRDIYVKNAGKIAPVKVKRIMGPPTEMRYLQDVAFEFADSWISVSGPYEDSTQLDGNMPAIHGPYFSDVDRGLHYNVHENPMTPVRKYERKPDAEGLMMYAIKDLLFTGYYSDHDTENSFPSDIHFSSLLMDEIILTCAVSYDSISEQLEMKGNATKMRFYTGVKEEKGYTDSVSFNLRKRSESTNVIVSSSFPHVFSIFSLDEQNYVFHLEHFESRIDTSSSTHLKSSEYASSFLVDIEGDIVVLCDNRLKGDSNDPLSGYRKPVDFYTEFLDRKNGLGPVFTKLFSVCQSDTLFEYSFQSGFSNQESFHPRSRF